MEVNLGVAIVGLSTTVVFGYLLFIWWLDRYKREPFWLVMVAFLWGAIGGTALGCTIGWTLSMSAEAVVSAIYTDLLTAVVIAPLVEEFTKGLIFVALVFSPHLDNETDGLIYGAAAGLGFAVVENLLYFELTAAMGPEAFLGTVVVRTALTSLMHCISTALLGYTIGYVRHRQILPWLWMVPVFGFLLAVSNHGLWNFFAWTWGSEILSEDLSSGAVGLGVLLIFCMSLAMFVIIQVSLMREQKIIGKYLRAEAQEGVLPMAHAEIVPSWRKRRKQDWLPAHIPHKKYVTAATLLAFRRYQADTAATRHRQRYEEKVEKQRRRVQSYLAGG